MSSKETREAKLRTFLAETFRTNYLTFEVQLNDEDEGLTDFTVRITAEKGKYHDYGDFVMRVEDESEEVLKLMGEDFEPVDSEEFLRHMFLQQFLIGPEEAADLEREKKTGAHLIMQERRQQIEKHGYTVEVDLQNNQGEELVIAAIALLELDYPDDITEGRSVAKFPAEWNEKACIKMASQPYAKRLVIAGALIAAEIDRIQSID